MTPVARPRAVTTAVIPPGGVVEGRAPTTNHREVEA